MRKPEPRTLPRFAPRLREAPLCPDPPAIPARPRFGRALEVLHKLLTGGAALGTILRLLF
ncbi:hypothetical protein [Falsiroseomonas sp.]|jgi:hypothetical protein|uniref:hypothetical protein n=1 Tax=Falsiroseomonas sp. TaxID=2870721 RepID=UPI003F701A60